MSIKRVLTSIADRCTNKLDEKMIRYVDSFVDDSMSDLEKAISIYLCLGDVLCYDPYFALTCDYNKASMTRNISPDNNEMICKSWSFLYCRLLKLYGIKAKVERNKAHYKVLLNLNDVEYSIDATIWGGDGYYQSMSDTARIKFGFKIARFNVSGIGMSYDKNVFTNHSLELKKTIDKVYKKQNRKVISEEQVFRLCNKVVEKVQYHGRVNGVGSLTDINYRVDMINRFWGMNINDQGAVEKAQLFNSFFRKMFEDYDDYYYTYKSYSVFAYKNHKLKIYKLLAFDIDGQYYYFMDDGKKFISYTKQDVIREFSKRNARVSEFTEVPGLFVGLEAYRIKAK